MGLIKQCVLLACMAAALISCKTGADAMLSSADGSAAAALEETENAIVAFDAGFTREDLAAARGRIRDLEARPVSDREYRARLAAFSGRLYILEGRRSEAQKQLAVSREALPGCVQAAVLASRLEEDAAKRLGLIGEALKREEGELAGGELYIERARTFMDTGSYREAVAAFDTAFARLSPVYRQTYGPARDRAWELRNVQGGNTARLAQLDSLSWREAIELTRGETNLLTFLTAGRDWPAGDIFTRLAGRGFIPAAEPVSVTEFTGKPLMRDTVSRAGAAWYLWRLVAENRADKSLLDRYSSRYRTALNPQSPVADVPVGSVFFDAILGCVEWEIMNLSDGRNFSPSENVRGAAFLAMLAKAAAAR